MQLDEQYPKTNRDLLRKLRPILERANHLDPGEREEIARAITDMADLACDLEDICQRLVHEQHTMKEIGELLIAFELTTEQIRGHSDTIDGKLYEIADRLKGVRKANSKVGGRKPKARL